MVGSRDQLGCHPRPTRRSSSRTGSTTPAPETRRDGGTSRPRCASRPRSQARRSLLHLHPRPNPLLGAFEVDAEPLGQSRENAPGNAELRPRPRTRNRWSVACALCMRRSHQRSGGRGSAGSRRQDLSRRGHDGPRADHVQPPRRSPAGLSKNPRVILEAQHEETAGHARCRPSGRSDPRIGPHRLALSLWPSHDQAAGWTLTSPSRHLR